MLCYISLNKFRRMHRNRLPCLVLNLFGLYIFIFILARRNFGQEDLRTFIFSSIRRSAKFGFGFAVKYIIQPHSMIYVTYACKRLELFWTHVVKLCTRFVSVRFNFYFPSTQFVFCKRSDEHFSYVICKIWYTTLYLNADD